MEVKFHLVGSRFFGTHRPNSDYDYLAEDIPENHQLCVSMGLKKLDSPFQRYYGHGVDVCLVSNLDVRLKARDELAKLPNVRQLSKRARHSKLKELIDAYTLG